MITTLPTPEAFSAPVLPASVMQDICLIQDQYPAIGEKIRQLSWGSIELQSYLTTIIFDERGGRQGFPNAIASALLRIYATHSTLAPSTSGGDIWDHILKGIGS